MQSKSYHLSLSRFMYFGSRLHNRSNLSKAGFTKHVKPTSRTYLWMTDIFSKKKRSYVMSRIHGKNTGIEIRMKRMLRAHKIRFRQHPKMHGSPDFLVGTKTAVFCDGDFWHGYKYAKKKRPAKKFWRDKIEGNMRRDRRVSQRLRRNGYSVIRLWEHDIDGKPEACIRKITRFMR